MTSIQPGASVRDREGVIGWVERVDTAGSAHSDRGNTLVVRQTDSRDLLAFPVKLVSSIREAEGQQFIQLDIARAKLGNYAVMGQPATSDPTAAQARAASTRADARREEMIAAPLAAEELAAGTRETERETLRVQKGVEEVETNTAVPVAVEDVEIEHLAPDAYDPNTPSQPDEWVVPVHEERLVISKQTVVKEYLRIRKRSVMREVPVRDTLRREYVEVRDAGPGSQPLQPSTLAREQDADQPGQEAQ